MRPQQLPLIRGKTVILMSVEAVVEFRDNRQNPENRPRNAPGRRVHVEAEKRLDGSQLYWTKSGEIYWTKAGERTADKKASVSFPTGNARRGSLLKATSNGKMYKLRQPHRGQRQVLRPVWRCEFGAILCR